MKPIKIRNMKEFAAASGISRPTVSKYFNDPRSVTKSSRVRIEEALERFDYRPNIYAINQNRRQTKHIGVVVPYLADPVFAEMVRVIEWRCIRAGFSPTLFSAYGESALEVDLLENLRSMKPAGVLLAPLGRESDIAAIEDFCRDVPTVLLDRNIEGLGEAFVGSNNHSFLSGTVEYLLSTGEAPCFFEMRQPANPNAHKRREAYFAIMEQLKLKPHRILLEGSGWGIEEVGRQGALQLLEEESLPTDTVLCSNDRLAFGFLSACFEKGISVGRGKELRVASHDNHPFSRFTCPPLTTAAHDYASVSEYAVKTLFRLIESGGRFSQREETLFPAQLIVRDSA